MKFTRKTVITFLGKHCQLLKGIQDFQILPYNSNKTTDNCSSPLPSELCFIHSIPAVVWCLSGSSSSCAR